MGLFNKKIKPNKSDIVDDALIKEVVNSEESSERTEYTTESGDNTERSNEREDNASDTTGNERNDNRSVLDSASPSEQIYNDEVVLVNEPITLDELYVVKGESTDNMSQAVLEDNIREQIEESHENPTVIDTEAEELNDTDFTNMESRQDETDTADTKDNYTDNLDDSANIVVEDNEDSVAGSGKAESTGESSKGKQTKEKKKISKKTRNIIIAIVTLIVVLTVSIVTPILVINKGKIFVSKAEDLLKTKGDIYVINKDIAYDGDLTLGKDIDLKGNHLVVKGTLTIDITKPDQHIGTIKKGVFVAEGNITATNMRIVGRGDIVIANAITADALDIASKRVMFSSNIIIHNELNLNSDNLGEKAILFSGAVNFGNNVAQVNIKRTNVEFAQGVYARVNAEDSTIVVKEKVGNINLDVLSELRCSANVIDDFASQSLGYVKGGKMVYMSSDSSARTIDGAKLYWTDQSNKNILEEINIGEKKYIVKLQTPTYGNIKLVGDKLLLKVDVVHSAERYSMRVDQEPEIIINVSGRDLITDKLSDALSKVGKHIVTIVAMGASGEEEFVQNSEPMQLLYEHNMILSTPTDIKVDKGADNTSLILSFKAVIFADYYEVVVDTIKLDKIGKEDGLANGRINIDLTKLEKLANKLTVGKHIVTVVARSNNPSIKPSESDFATFEILGKHDKVMVQYDAEISTLSWNSVDTALTYSVYTVADNGTLTKVATVKSSAYIIKTAGKYVVKVDRNADGYYQESDVSNTLECSIRA